MKKNHSSKSGIFNLRVLLTFTLCSVGSLLAMLGFAANPPSGTTTQVPGGQNDRPGAVRMPADSATWSIVTSANTSTTQENVLYGVTCISASNCWAVGEYYDNVSGNYKTLIEQWNGSAWSVVTSPNANATEDNELYGVTCLSASDCWAVGEYSNGTADQTLVEHWNGASWAIVTSANTSATQENYIRAVTCISASDCWAVGDYEPTGATQTLIEHWNGTSWAIIPSANTSSTQNNDLYGVTCVSASNCQAVGYHSVGSGNQTLIEQWDGTSWSIVASPNFSGAQHNFLESLACTSASNCWAVGEYFDTSNHLYRTLIEQWNGNAWSIVTSPNVGNNFNELYGVTCTSASQCWAVGFYYDDNSAAYQTLIEQWNGSAWSVVTSANTSTTQDNHIYSVTCTSASDCRTVGYYYQGATPQTLIEALSVPVQVTSAVSRKSHGAAGNFDVDLPLTGTTGVECRSGSGATNDFTMVVTFAGNVAVTGSPQAQVTTGAGTIGSGGVSNGGMVTVAGNVVTIPLTNVADQQTINVTLNGVNSAADSITANVVIPMSRLLGDTNGNRSVNASDVSQTKGRTGQAVTTTNFRSDVNANGAINAGDASLVKTSSGHAVP